MLKVKVSTEQPLDRVVEMLKNYFDKENIWKYLQMKCYLFDYFWYYIYNIYVLKFLFNLQNLKCIE
jgi:hypothetical protein